MRTNDTEKTADKSDAFDHEAETENLRRIGGDEDDDDVVTLDDQDDEVADRATDDDPDGESRVDPADEPDDDAEEGKDKGKQAKGEKLSPKLQARIDRLTARAKDAEDRAAELEGTAGDATERLGYAQRSGAMTAKAGVESEIAQIETAMEAAIEAGDTKTQVKLQKQLAQATNKLDKVDGWLARNPEPKPGETRERQPQQRTERTKAGRDRFVPAARPWYDANKTWFDDPKATVERAAVQAIDAELGREDFDPDSDEWYEELTKRLHAKMPHLKSGGKTKAGDPPPRRQQTGRQRTAGVERESDGPTPRSEGRTDLSNDDKRLMRTFKLDPSNDKHVKEFYRQRKVVAR